MQQHGQVALGRQVVDTRHGFIIGTWRVATGQRCQVIMSGEHLADALPQPRVHIEHALDMADSILVHRVETAEERVEPLALLTWQLLQRRRHVCVGGAVPIGVGVITGVVARALGLVFVPFLGHGYA